MAYAPGERDLVMLQHKFVVEWADGTTEIRTSTLEAYGAPTGQGHSAMARTVGLPCGIATQMVLDNVLKEPGVHVPYTEKVCQLLRVQLEKEGIGLVEKVL
jgi:spermidine synthase